MGTLTKMMKSTLSVLLLLIGANAVEQKFPTPVPGPPTGTAAQNPDDIVYENGFECDTRVNWMNAGPEYSQISLTDGCKNNVCDANPRYGGTNDNARPFSTANTHATREMRLASHAKASSSRSITTVTKSVDFTQRSTRVPKYGVDTRLVQYASVLDTNSSAEGIATRKLLSLMSLNARKPSRTFSVLRMPLFTHGIPQHMLRDALNTIMETPDLHKH